MIESLPNLEIVASFSVGLDLTRSNLFNGGFGCCVFGFEEEEEESTMASICSSPSLSSPAMGLLMQLWGEAGGVSELCEKGDVGHGRGGTEGDWECDCNLDCVSLFPENYGIGKLVVASAFLSATMATIMLLGLDPNVNGLD